MFYFAVGGVVINLFNFMILGHPPNSIKDQRHTGHSHDHGHGHGHGHSQNINMRGAVLHVIGDSLQSVGVLIASILIWTHQVRKRLRLFVVVKCTLPHIIVFVLWMQSDPNWLVVDPICTISFVVLVLGTTSFLLRDIVEILMEKVPRSVDINNLRAALREVSTLKSFQNGICLI